MPLIKASYRPKPKTKIAVASLEIHELPSALQSPNLEERRVAVRAALLADAADLLVAHLSREGDQSVREVILNGFVSRRGSIPVNGLLDLLRTEDVGLRNAVIETLQVMGDAILPDIESLLSDPDADVRIFCVNILQAIGSPQTPDIALKIAMSDDDVNVCAAAIDILAERGRPDMAPMLSGVAARFPHHAFLAFAVRSALKRIG